MKSKLSLIAVGHATSFLIVLSYILCVVFDLIFPQYAMNQTWQNLLPGFKWLSWTSFSLGLFESYIYGWFIALIWTPVFNMANNSSTHRSAFNNDEVNS